MSDTDLFQAFPDGSYVFNPRPKGLRWLFLPTVLMGGLAVLGGAAQLLALGGSKNASSVTATVLLGFGSLMVVVGVYAVSLRSRYRLASGALFADRSWLLGKRTKRVPLESVRCIELMQVRTASNAHQANPVPNFTAVLLRDANSVVVLHLHSAPHPRAEALAQQLAALTGLQIARGPASS